MSNTLPWRTLATPSTPSDLSAPSIALPCGSRMPDFRVTVTRAFIVRLQICFRPAPSMHRFGRFFQQAAVAGEPAAGADQPQGGPERSLRAGHHRDAVTGL